MDKQQLPKKLAVIGAGGLGHAALWGITTSWPEGVFLEIDIFDDEQVELSNLNRQVLFTEKDIGKKKTTRVAQSLTKLSPNPAITYQTHLERISSSNIAQALKGVEFVIDATDSTETKFLINDHCIKTQTPFCYAGVLGRSGQLLSVPADRRHVGCLRCLFGEVTKEDFTTIHTSCREGGIVGAVCGEIGFLQAEEALLTLLHTGREHSLLTRFSLDTLEHVTSVVHPSSDCSLGCGSNAQILHLDLTDKRCPMTFVYTKLAVEKLKTNQKLHLCFDSEETLMNVSASCKEEGFITEITNPGSTNQWSMLVSGASKEEK